ncbi:MAG: flagellar hook-length control protein FliK [Candidatus Thiodiazotropha sp. (ex Semelilucina semeliformis)]|nr:flagellar hook-length control protein FliK [Candidatus Thiodiazotropha sp. (ex Semelilucina semeliformis)]
MQIPSTKLLLPPSTLALREPLLQNLKPGQILQGTALSDNVNGKLSLQIGVTRLIAQTQVSVRPGQALTLQVVKTDNLPELRVLTLPSLSELKAAALKTLLPRQQPLPEVFKALNQIIQAPAKSNIPPAIKAQATSLLSQTPVTSDPVFRDSLKSAITSSGLLTESKLLRQVTTESIDMKLNLVRLYQAVRQLVPEHQFLAMIRGSKPLPQAERSTTGGIADNGIKLLIGLLKNLDGGIARIQTHQLNSLPQEDPIRQVWQFELPIRNEQDVDLFHFRISRENAPHEEADEQLWNLTLHMNLSTLGPMRVQLKLQGDIISTIIWSENNQTDKLVRNHLDRLRQGYENSGLEVKRLEAFVGIIDDNHEIPTDLSLLHEKA